MQYQILDLLNKVAESMDCNVVKYNDINDAINKEVSFSNFVDTSSYITKEELSKLKQKNKYL